MSKEKTVVYLQLNEKSGMFFDPHSGVKILPGQQVQFHEEDLKDFPRLEAGLRSGHIMKTSKPISGKVTVGQENSEEKPEEEKPEEEKDTSVTATETKKEDDEDEDDEDEDDEDEDDEDEDDEEDEEPVKKKVPATSSKKPTPSSKKKK